MFVFQNKYDVANETGGTRIFGTNVITEVTQVDEDGGIIAKVPLGRVTAVVEDEDNGLGCACRGGGFFGAFLNANINRVMLSVDGVPCVYDNQKTHIVNDETMTFYFVNMVTPAYYRVSITRGSLITAPKL